MRSRIVGLVLAIAIAANAGLLAKDKGVGGKWTMTVEGMTIAMELVQRGKKITGTLESPHGPIHVTGEFSKGRLKIAGATDGRDHPLEISGTGTLQRDGTLVGDLKSTVGDMSWTAVREASR
jgi:hypothetical protein